MAVTAFRFPTATPVNSGVVNPDNAWADDGVYATIDGLTDTVRYGTFGDFSIPAGAQILGVEFVVNGKYTGAGVNRTLGIRWTVSGGAPWSNTKTLSVPNTTDSDMTFGGATDMWGITTILTDANFDNITNFQVELSMLDFSVTSVDIDSVKVRLYYDDSVIELEGFRFRDDDGNETAASWLAAQDTDVSREISDITRLRVLLNVTNDPPTRQYQLEYKEDSGSTYKKVLPQYFKDLTLLGSPLEHETTQGQFNRAVEIDSTHWLLIYQGAAGDGFARVFTIDGSGNVTAAGAALEFDTVDNLGCDVIMWDATHALVVWGGSGSDGFAQVLTVNTSTWAVTTNGTALEYNTLQGLHPRVAQVDSTHALVVYQGDAGDGFAQILDINTTTWAVTDNAAASLEFDTADASFITLHKINNDNTRWLVFHQGAAADGFVRVLTVNTSTWAITATSSLEFDTVNGVHNATVMLDSTHFLNFWGGATGAIGKAQVFEVNTTSWAVTPLGAAFDFDSAAATYMSAVVTSQSNGYYYVMLTYADSSSLGKAQYLRVHQESWEVFGCSDAVTIDTTLGQYNSVVKVSSTRVINFWAGSGSDGFVQAIDIKTPPVTLAYTDNIGGARIPYLGQTVSRTVGGGNTLNHTIDSGTKMLVIAVGNHQGTVSAVDVSGVAATKEHGAATAFNEIAELWYIANPTPGAVTITPTFSGGSGRMIVAFNVIGSKTSNPTTSNVANGSSTAPSVSVTPASGNALVVDATYAEANFTATGANQFPLANLLGASFEAFHVSLEKVVTAAATVMNKTISSGQRWATVAMVLEADPANTTAQLTAPSGKTTSDFVAGKIRDDENPAATVDITTDDYTELEWAIIVNSTAVVGDVYQFRVTKAGSVFDTYSVVPELTVIATTTRRRNFPLWI